MVRDDATYAVITSGNFEVVFRRHRASQTLYMSDVLEPSESEAPSHYHLHTSLIVASCLDVLDRVAELERIPKLDPTTPWLSTYAKDYAYDSLVYPAVTLPFGAGTFSVSEEKRTMVRGGFAGTP